MIECQVRALFTEIASSEPGSAQVDTQLAHRRGRARLRWHRACVAGAPVLAAAAVTAVALAVSAAGPSRPGPGPVATGPSAPRHFSPLDPYVSYGWLPAGISPVEGGTSRQVVWLNAAPKPDSALEWSLDVYAAGQCRLIAHSGELKCRAPEGITAHITGRAPAVHGHRAFWASPFLVWQYARNGWASLVLPVTRNSPQLAAYQRQAVKIASQVRYGTPTPPLLFPVQLTHLPSRWQVSSVAYYPDAGVLRAQSYALGAGPPNLGADGGLVYETGLPWFTIAPAARRASRCYAAPHRSVRETINGYQVVVTHQPFGRLDLCASDADGLSLYIMEAGAHPAISTAGIFGQHMRLLGRHPANWTTKPIG